MKDKFADIADEFKDAVAAMDDVEINKRLGEISMLSMAEKEFMSNDPDVLQAKENLKDLTQPYRESIKEMRLKAEYCKSILDNRGKGAEGPQADKPTDTAPN